MTQVQTMTNDEIRDSLIKLCGFEVKENIFFEDDDPERYYLFNHPEKLFVKHWNPCTDPAASLEVQTAAIAKDALGYVQALADVLVIDIRSRTLYSISRLINATPRERAEAAYITLQGAKENG